tara:strand:- start:4797 stop:8138 length:3342 start_codon:yes stop_codon:yes gene_type:complete
MEFEEPLSIHSFLESMKIRNNPKTTTSFSINPIQKEPSQDVVENKDTINEELVLDERPKHVVEIFDRRKSSNIDRQVIMQQLQSLRFVKTMETQFETPSKPIEVEMESKEEEKEETKEEETKEGEEEEIFNLEDSIPKKDMDQVDIPIENVIVSKSRRVKPKTIITMNVDDIEVNGKKIGDRMPKIRERQINKASSYYMNNRKLYIEKINKLFQPYLKELKETKDVTCENRGSAGNELFTHQKIILDYLNLITPYRGLLLLHGLGSGKTCGSIAIAEGMKTDRKIVIMTPASLKMNFFTELKKCGDPLFKKNQHWEFVSTIGQPDLENILSSSLVLPKELIKKQKGAWLVDSQKPSNYSELSNIEQDILDKQLNEMIRVKYLDLNYNGLNETIIKNLTENHTINPFDNSVVIVDEAHNLVSRIVNKIKAKKSVSYTLYQLLLSANNCKIVFLSGTPIINYPNEIAVLFNMLRGYIKTWNIPLKVKTTKKINKETIIEILNKERFHTYDYIEYTNNSLIVTRNPYGFINTKKKLYKDAKKDIFHDYSGVKLDDTGNISDEDFQKILVNILKKNDIDVIDNSVKVDFHTALPDDSDSFTNMFVNNELLSLNNEYLFKRRILGLTSYFKSAQESLLPSFILDENNNIFHIVATEMSEYQFSIYEKIRKDEAENEKVSKRMNAKNLNKQMFKISTTYRIYSRACCNFAFPNPPGRPMPAKKENVTESELDGIDVEDETALENPKEINNEYIQKIQYALKYLQDNANDFLKPDGLNLYSPKFLEILQNLNNKDHIGLHLIYSQFRTLEGIGILKLILEANGYAEFKIQKSENTWMIVENEEDQNKPKFLLYTGTEEAEEKEHLRNIFNSSWDFVPLSITNELKKKSENNYLGEIVKIMMITSSGAEGINLENTRYVHIVEPYWNMSRLEQVIGRARRICSHQNLPLELRNVQVFLYLTTLSKEQSTDPKYKELQIRDFSRKDKKTPITTDENLYEISQMKNNLNKQFLKSIKETSIDCSIHNKDQDLICFNYGKINSNEHSTIPSIELDILEQEDVKKETKIKIKDVKIQNVTYKLNIKTNEFYSLENYERHTEFKEPLIPLGVIKKQGKNFIVDKYI